jgi:WD40 repeat protein/tetratricopeptide (TPR) repeat protein/predicted Ser/Thr protein kinase
MSNSFDATGSFNPLDQLIASYLEALEHGIAPSREQLLNSHPDLREALAKFFADFDAIGQDASKFKLPISHRTAETIAHRSTNQPDLPKLQYLGDYQLLAEIARGGMGVVYRARQVSLNRSVAVKMILAGTYATPEAIQRFRVEAEAAANLDHPNLLPIYEVGEHEGHQYFSMKLIEGGSLASKIVDLKSRPREIASLLVKLARAVQFAHQRGILHHDLKPANILIDHDETPFITDFGLAKRVDADDGSTRTGSIVGTPSYMAPEQARGEKTLTTGVDVYSLGAILYEMLTGQPPFRGDNIFETVKQVLEQEPLDPRKRNPSADRDLSVIALKCLRKNPQQRYLGAGELADDLERFVRGEPISAREVGRLERSWKWVRRNPVVSALGLTLLLVCLVGTSVIVAKYLEAKQLRDEAILQAKKENDLRQSAERAEGVSRQRLIRSYLERAAPFVMNGDLSKALPWMTAAWLQEPGDEILNLRVAMALRRFPRLVRFEAGIQQAHLIEPNRLLLHDKNGMRLIDWEKNMTLWGPIKLPPKQEGSSAYDPDRFQLVVSPDQKRVALSDGFDRRCQVFDLESGKAIGPVLNHPTFGNGSVIFHLPKPPTFSPDSKLLLLASEMQTNRESYRWRGEVFEIATGKLAGTPFEQDYDDYGRVGLSRDFRYWTGEDINRERRFIAFAILDRETGKEIPLEGLKPDLRGQRLVLSPDGKRVAISWYDDIESRTGIWSLPDGKRIAIPNQKDNSLPGKAIDWAPDCSELYLSRVGSLDVYETPKFERKTTRVTNGDDFIFSVQKNWYIESGKPIRICRRTTPEMVNAGVIRDFSPDFGEFQSGSFSPDEELFASISDEGRVIVWQCSTGAPWTPPLPHNGRVQRVAFSADHRYLLVVGKDVRLWDLSTVEITPNEFGKTQLGEGGYLSISKNRDRLLKSALNGGFEQYDTRGNLLSSFIPPGRWSIGNIRSSNGKRVLLASPSAPEGPIFPPNFQADQYSVQLWDLDRGKALGPVWTVPNLDVQLSPDGRYLVRCEEIVPKGQGPRLARGALTIFDAATGKPLHRLEESEHFHFLGFSSNDESVLVFRFSSAVELPRDQLAPNAPATTPVPPGLFVERVHLGNGQKLPRRFTLFETETQVPQFRLSPQATRLMFQSRDEGWQVYDLERGKKVGTDLRLIGINRNDARTGVGLISADWIDLTDDDQTAISVVNAGEKEIGFRLANVQTGELLGPQETITGGSVGPHCLLDPKGRFMLFRSNNSRFLLVDRRFSLPVALGPYFSPHPEMEFDASGERLLALDRLEPGWFSLAPDRRDPEEIRKWTQLLSGVSVDETGRLNRLLDDEIRQLWKQLYPSPPPLRSKSNADEIAWHRLNALKFQRVSPLAAIPSLKRLTELEPEQQLWPEKWGRECIDAFQSEECFVAFERALKLGPLSPSSLENWGIELLSRKKYPEAERVFELYDQRRWLDGNYSVLLYRLNNLVRLGELDRCRDRIHEEIKRFRYDEFFYSHELLMFACHLGNVPELKRILPLAREWDAQSNQAHSRFLLAALLYRLQQPDEALKLLRKLQEEAAYADEPSIHLFHAACEALTGDITIARKSLATGEERMEKAKTETRFLLIQYTPQGVQIPLLERFRDEVKKRIEAKKSE